VPVFVEADSFVLMVFVLLEMVFFPSSTCNQPKNTDVRRYIFVNGKRV